MDDWNSPEFVVHFSRVYGAPPGDILERLAPLELKPWDRFIDFGCGNGSSLALAGRQAGLAVGVDASERQLKLARESLSGLPQVKLIDSAFLDFSWEDDPFTKAMSRRALHHLSDAEKALFFKKAHDWLAPGSLFLIEDAIFDFDRDELPLSMPKVLAEAQAYYGADWRKKRPELERCLRDEYPSGFPQWEKALACGCFKIVERQQKTCFYGTILAKREKW
ncbi:MAG: methyltransferase domain-containing protein [Elusimicrobia bacterium]|nr:methyltransferase domain-containing protein [Elusimicrobiota bacterium]